MSESAEVRVKGLHEVIRGIEWGLISREALEAVARRSNEAVIELLFANTEVDPVLRRQKVVRIVKELIAYINSLQEA